MLGHDGKVMRPIDIKDISLPMNLNFLSDMSKIEFNMDSIESVIVFDVRDGCIGNELFDLRSILS